MLKGIIVPQLAHLTEADIRRYVAGTVSVTTGAARQGSVPTVCSGSRIRLSVLVLWERRGLLQATRKDRHPAGD